MVEVANTTISAVSRTRALNGDARFSAQTLEAISNGAIPPVVVKPRERVANTERPADSVPKEVELAAAETAGLQQPAEQPTLEDVAVILEISNEALRAAGINAQTFSPQPAANTSAPAEFDVPAVGEFTLDPVAAPSASSEAESSTESEQPKLQTQTIIPQQNRDTASTALGNTVDIKA